MSITSNFSPGAYFLTIFTPTYNRAYCLPELYKSLLKQDLKNFIWLIIDDGSNDNTREIVLKWQQDNIIKIEYIHQKNQGMHGAHNTAYKNIFTPFNVCIDSDDYLAENAVQKIYCQTKLLEDNYAGIIGLDAFPNGEIVGTKIPKEIKKSSLQDLYEKYNVKGDKKLIYRTDVIKAYPEYPVFENESFVPLDYKYLLIDQDYLLKTSNEIYCIVNYMDDGSTKNIIKQYRNNPNGFSFARINRLRHSNSIKRKFMDITHLISSALILKNTFYLKKVENILGVIICLPLGILLYGYVRLRSKL
ncbi:glycosyltransferase family 2 protein [Robertkochia marina]|uniref:Glycosyltransferase family 2 protein n=1 Tax=Robertkochia marina TaxID=1227945 RepID=A0A4S3LZB3_9FLAO|nr:glycosyltransferase family 2 protein [Robertkochia marina]THD66776.1 glycosyltransferase family 2 protein [Robertkochia marina]TRZ41933.1 glycosyltransferase family 2 protein [Robertkochia marina]